MGFIGLIIGLLGLGLNHTTHIQEADYNSTVLTVVNGYKDGGGYLWSGTGTPIAITHQNQTILAKSSTGKTYCCGFTFAIAMTVAQQHQLLQNKTVTELKKFQQEWFGATPTSAEKQPVIALSNIGLGKEVNFKQAKPGDFVQFWRGKTGHSAVFKGWVKDDKDSIVGLKYRSTQKSTNGIGDKQEFFEDSKLGEVKRERTYFARITP